MKHRHYKILDSTQEQAKRLISEGIKDELVLITTDEQTSGYGRYGKVWVSPRGKNIACSYLFFSKKDADVSTLAVEAARKVADILSGYCKDVSTKMPNDVLIAKKKVAGIIVERHDAAVILGIGINVNATAEDLAAVNQPVTSLLIETGHFHDLAALQNNLNDPITKLIRQTSV